MVKNKRLFVVSSEPSYYQVPIFCGLEDNINVSVLFCIKKQREYKDEEFGINVNMGINVLFGYKYRFLKNFSLQPYNNFWGQVNFGVVKEIFLEKPDFLWVNGWNSFTNWLAFLAAFLIGTKVFLRAESPLNQELLKPKWKLFLKKLVFKPLFKKISAFLYIGEENRKFYKYYGVPDEKLFFTPYAVDNDRFMAAAEELKPKRKELRKKLLGIEDDRPIILFVGKLIDKKRPLDLLRAYELLITDYQLPITPSLLFVGDGALRPELEKYTKEHELKGVHFAGFKNQTELPEYYAIADVFVLPSGPGETWGLVVNEAMCFGLPVIVSDMVGCAPDLVENGKNGFVFPMGNIREISRCLSVTVFDTTLRNSLREGAIRKVFSYNYKNDVVGIKAACS